MRARLSFVLLVCAALGVDAVSGVRILSGVDSVSLLAQTAQPVRETPQSTFRAGANYVRVDMYATRDGLPIEDLRAEEIEVVEDGAAQTIEAFEHIKVRTATPQDSRIEPNTVAESRQMAADPRARVFVVFLDTYHTQFEGSAAMRTPLVRFIDTVVGPDDLIAVMTPDMAASDLTLGRKTTIISDIANNAFWGRRGRIADNDPKEDLYESCYAPGSPVAAEMKARRREKIALDALDELTVHLNGIREERKAVLVVTEGWKLYGPNRQLADSAPTNNQGAPPLPGPFSRGRGDSNDRDRTSGNVRVECDTDRVALAALDDRMRLREITETANRSNVSFYTVYARGLTPNDAPIGPDRPPDIRTDSANLAARQDSLKFLAENTDATWVMNTNNIDGALKRIVADVSSYYLFGYYSTNTKLDGKFRNITIRVKRPGVQVRARRGYRGPTADAVLAAADKGSPAPAGSGLTTALGVVAGTSTRVPFRIRTASWRGDSADVPPSLWIVGELDYTTKRDVAWTAGAKAEITVVGADGKQVASTILDVPAADGTFALRLPDDSGVAPGDYAIRVRIRAEADPSSTLTDSTRATVPSQTSVLGEAIMWRRGPSTGIRYLHTADPRFQRTERLRLEMPTRAAGTAVARMLDRTGKTIQLPVTVSTRADAAGFSWIVADATLAPLAAGDYAIEVTLADAKQITAFRVVP